MLFIYFDGHPQKPEIQVAFMADVHLLDVHGTLEGIGYQGPRNPKTGEPALIRTMDAQLRSTRLFNENYFAFRAALDDAVRRGIKLVALPGDFSDDGQPVNIRGLNRILDAYSEKHGVSFFLTTGNHDPVRPFDTVSGKSDFLGDGGKAQPIMSEKGMYSHNPAREHPTIISKDVRALGYKGIVNGLKEHGFFPKSDYLYWETPFCDYGYEGYSYKRAKKASRLQNRTYQMPNSEAALPDVSYVVEPIDGLWLLAIDANVYVPEPNSEAFEGAGIGYNQVLEYKKHLILWVSNVTKEAKRLGKTLIAFSHYPMVDFNDGASEEMASLLGKDALQAYRIPDKKVAEVFADAGLKIHFGGHMHLNDTGIFESASGNTLVNVQSPSLAAYKPAYKIATILPNHKMKVQTVTLDSVPGFEEFFELYRKEHQFLETLKSKGMWDLEVLASKNYREYTNWHLKELVRLRFLPEDWPAEVQELFLPLDGSQFLVLSNTDAGFSKTDLQLVLKGDAASLKVDDPSSKRNALSGWEEARRKTRVQLSHRALLSQNVLELENFKNWTGFDLLYDFYRLRNADRLALKDIGEEKLLQYRTLLESFENHPKNPNFSEFWLFANIFRKQLQGEPAGDFIIDLNQGKVTPILNEVK